jgi:putative colanic acid biosynthesis acetyltransferase WcaF
MENELNCKCRKSDQAMPAGGGNGLARVTTLSAGPMTRVRNDLFNPKDGLDRGRSFWVEAMWYMLKCLLFLPGWPMPSSVKCLLLRSFGARVGKGVVIKPRVNIHFPWKLAVGDYTWLGEEVFILNFEPVTIGAHCCISQRAFLCTGNHDYRQPEMPYRNCPITVEDGAWIGAQVFVGPGVTVGIDAVVTAGSVATKSVPPGLICSGNPCIPVKERWPETCQDSPLPETTPYGPKSLHRMGHQLCPGIDRHRAL